MEAITSYLERLRKLIPARTIGIYLLGNALMLALVDKPEDIAGKFAWLIFVINGACLVFNFLGSMLIDRKTIVATLISTGALLLMALCQRFYGPLAAFGVDTQVAFVVVGFLAAIYVVVVPTVYTADPVRPA